MEIRTIGIDLGKTVFHLAGVNTRGEVVVRKKCSRTQLPLDSASREHTYPCEEKHLIRTYIAIKCLDGDLAFSWKLNALVEHALGDSI
jgi:hypothetical protein